MTRKEAYKCALCPFQSHTKVFLISHVAARHSTCFDCKVHQKGNLSREQVLDHLLNCHDYRTNCRFCKHRAMYEFVLKLHEVLVHYACVNCGKSMKSLLQLLEHQHEENICASKVPSSYKVNKCDLCNYIAPSLTLKKHVRESHKDNTESSNDAGQFCRYCNCGFRRGNLLRHMKLKHKELCATPLVKSDDYIDPERLSAGGTTSKSKVFHILPRPKPGKWIVPLQKLQF